jgi:hypothetical protein
MSHKQHILLLGGTGVCGQIFAQAALDAGYQLTLYVRTPSKLGKSLIEHPALKIIEGTYDDIDGLSSAASCGADIFISTAGPTLGRRDGTVSNVRPIFMKCSWLAGKPITEALCRLYPLLLKANPRIRILALATASYSAQEDRRSIKWFVSITGYVRVIGGDAYKEIRGIADETVALGDDVDWTVFRVPLLHGTKWDSGTSMDFQQGESDSANDGRSKNELSSKVHAVYVGQSHDGLWLDRRRLAKWILGELEEKKWLRSCPLVSDAWRR